MSGGQFMVVMIVAIVMIASRILPAGPDTNRRMDVPHSRFTNTPLPAQHAVPEA